LILFLICFFWLAERARNLIREFHLSPPGKGRGVSCDADGAFIGAIPVLNRLRKDGKDAWRPRDCGQLSEKISRHYGLPIDMSSKIGGLRAIANALNESDVPRAQIAAVLLGIPDPPQRSKQARPREQVIKLIRDLAWSGMLKWDADEHPRWPAGSADSKGGKFAPKGEGDDTASLALQSGAADRAGSYDSERDTTDRNTRAQLADVGMSDAADDPMAEAARRAVAAARLDAVHHDFEPDDVRNIVLAANEGEDDRDPRFGIGGNHPPPEELIPQSLQQSPAGPVVQFLDNLLDISGPGDEANLEVARLQMRALLHSIHEIDPTYTFDSIEPAGGLAGMSWQGRLNIINGLRADLAAAIYRVRGDIGPLQNMTLDFMQRTTNAAYDEAVELYNAGKLKVRLSPQEAIGNYMDGTVRLELRGFFNSLRIPMGPGSAIRVNSRAYDSSGSPPSYRLPDVRVGNFAFDTSLRLKSSSDPQIRGFFNADFAPVAVVIVRPNQLGSDSSYIIWRPNGD